MNVTLDAFHLDTNSAIMKNVSREAVDSRPYPGIQVDMACKERL